MGVCYCVLSPDSSPGSQMMKAEFRQKFGKDIADGWVVAEYRVIEHSKTLTLSWIFSARRSVEFRGDFRCGNSRCSGRIHNHCRDYSILTHVSSHLSCIRSVRNYEKCTDASVENCVRSGSRFILRFKIRRFRRIINAKYILDVHSSRMRGYSLLLQYDSSHLRIHSSPCDGHNGHFYVSLPFVGSSRRYCTHETVSRRAVVHHQEGQQAHACSAHYDD